MTDIQVNGTTIKAQLDTGAKCNVMPHNIYKTLQISTPIHKKSTKLTSYSGHIPLLTPCYSVATQDAMLTQAPLLSPGSPKIPQLH